MANHAIWWALKFWGTTPFTFHPFTMFTLQQSGILVNSMAVCSFADSTYIFVWSYLEIPYLEMYCFLKLHDLVWLKCLGRLGWKHLDSYVKLGRGILIIVEKVKSPLFITTGTVQKHRFWWFDLDFFSKSLKLSFGNKWSRVWRYQYACDILFTYKPIFCQ